MRITNQMLAKTAAKSGIPLQQNSLLNIMTKQYQSEENGLLSKIGKKKDDDLTFAALQQLKNRKNEKLQKHADSLNEFATKLNAAGEDSLFGKAEKSESTEEIVTNVSDHREALSAAGVTAGADGKLVIDEEKLKNADLETLKKAFGSTSGFTDKVGFIAGRVSENASASEYAFLNQYNEKGIANLESYVANHYNFWG